eukprot:364743-Chlamydomonas_euryale.AAC.90
MQQAVVIAVADVDVPTTTEVVRMTSIFKFAAMQDQSIMPAHPPQDCAAQHIKIPEKQSRICLTLSGARARPQYARPEDVCEHALFDAHKHGCTALSF